MRAVRIFVVVRVGVVSVGVASASAGSAPASATLGTNGLPMSSDLAAYRLSLDGTAALVGGTPSTSTPITKLSPPRDATASR